MVWRGGITQPGTTPIHAQIATSGWEASYAPWSIFRHSMGGRRHLFFFNKKIKIYFWGEKKKEDGMKHKIWWTLLLIDGVSISILEISGGHAKQYLASPSPSPCHAATKQGRRSNGRKKHGIHAWNLDLDAVQCRCTTCLRVFGATRPSLDSPPLPRCASASSIWYFLLPFGIIIRPI